MASGKWTPFQNYFSGIRMWRVGRIIDMDEPVQPSNLEYAGEYTTDREAAVQLAKDLNEKEERNGGE